MIYLKAEAGSCAIVSTKPNTLLNEHLGQKAHQGRMLHINQAKWCIIGIWMN